MSLVSSQEFLEAFFPPSSTVNLRIFDDKKRGIFKGSSSCVVVDRFSSKINELQKYNSLDYGIFFMVNNGVNDDKSVTGINAQFVEMDDAPFEEQEKLIKAFPLQPSLIVKTRRSYHVYWLVRDAKVPLFRPIQKALVAHFQGDPMCVNESRVMRLPGFYHCKKEPLMVECIYFHPEHKYLQDQLIAALPEYVAPSSAPAKFEEKVVGHRKGLAVVQAGCAFIQHCRDDAASLPEHDWYAMITNLAGFEDGIKRIHELSATYPSYKPDETDAKIQHFLKSGTGPITCKVIAEKGFQCPRLLDGSCPCRAPAAMAYQPLSTDALTALVNDLPVNTDLLKNLQAARELVESYLFNVDPVIATSIIQHTIKSHFKLSGADVKPLLITYKTAAHKYLKEKAAGVGEASAVSLPPWYTMSDNGPRFLPDILANTMTKEEHVYYAAERYFRYNAGVYREISDLQAANMVRTKMLEGTIRLNQINDAEGQWRMQILREINELNSNLFLINLRNGLYDVLEDKLLPHTPEYLCTVQLNVSYDHDATCPRFLKFLHESVEDDQVHLIQEILGYFMVPVTRAQKSFVIVGEAGAGKSQLLLVLNEILLGKENVSNVSWQALNERFKTAELFGKLANIFADLPTKNIDDNGIFKALVGEDYLTAERKNKNPFNFQSKARLIFSCNSIPRNYGDRSEGFYRRLIIIRFGHAVPKDKIDPELIDKFRSEADGIFLFALEGLQRLIKQDFKFSETEANRIELQHYREESNSVLGFVADCCVLDPKCEVGSQELFNQYKSYCADSNLSPCSQKTFTKELEAAYGSKVKKGVDKLGKRRTWRGIKFNTDLD